MQPGKAIITVSVSEAIKATCEVTVIERPVEIKLLLNLEAVKVEETETVQLTATLSTEGTSGTTVTWSSSAPEVATVDAKGLVTAVKPGTAAITATTADGLTATCQVTVVAKSTGIEGIENDGDKAVRVEGGSIIDPEGSEVFDLTGRRVKPEGLRSGIYIVRIPGAKAVKVVVR
ncbi:MAG: Ig-like domain-containing protein [Paramuribaculum sp.]|nr:Ig-like domain-containing protein [Paramuribaculum sp.]